MHVMNTRRPDMFIQKMMERLSDNCGQVCLFMVDNTKLNSEEHGIPYSTYEYKEGKLVSGPR